jgi:putative transposase
MRGKRFSEEQILRVLRAVEEGKAVSEVCREHGVSEQSIYNWRTKYGGLKDTELKRLKGLEEENRRLKAVVADQAVDIAILKEALSKKW